MKRLTSLISIDIAAQAIDIVDKTIFIVWQAIAIADKTIDIAEAIDIAYKSD